MTRTWRVEALLPMPRFVDLPGGHLPETMQFRSAVPVAIAASRGGLAFTLDAAPDHTFAAQVVPREVARLRTTVIAPDAQTALSVVAPLLEELVDYLAFQLQQSIPVMQLELLDLQPPVEVGENREALLFPAPNGYLFPKQQSSTYMGPVPVLMAPTLGPPQDWSEQHVRAARDWYLKGLFAQSDADRFMLFWISMEVLFDQSGIRILETPRCSRGHPQPETACPECGEVNKRMVRGASIKQYLTTRCGVSEQDAKQLWRVRQMFHGAIPFDSVSCEDVPRLSIVLQAATLDAIKAAAGARPDVPAIQPGGPSIRAFAMTVVRAVQEQDL